MYKKFLSLSSLIILISCSSNDDGSVYPESKKINFVEKIHGYEISDSYRWLEDFTSDQSINWVKRQNNYTCSMARTPLRYRTSYTLIGFAIKDLQTTQWP